MPASNADESSVARAPGGSTQPNWIFGVSDMQGIIHQIARAHWRIKIGD
jgi:hypothetical protein